MKAGTAGNLAAKAKRRSPLKVAATSQKKTANPTSIAKMQTAKPFTQAMEGRIVREETVRMAVAGDVVAGVAGIAEAAVEAAEAGAEAVAEAAIAEIAKRSKT
jgi:hypothetical protein